MFTRLNCGFFSKRFTHVIENQLIGLFYKIKSSSNLIISVLLFIIIDVSVFLHELKSDMKDLNVLMFIFVGHVFDEAEKVNERLEPGIW